MKEGMMRHLFPSVDLVLCVDSGHVIDSTSFRSNESSLGDQKRPRETGSLRIVLYGQITMNVLLVGSDTSEGRQCYAMVKCDVAHLYRLEDFG